MSRVVRRTARKDVEDRVLFDGTREAGTHEVVFEAGDLPSGTYLYRLETPQGSFVRTMLLAK